LANQGKEIHYITGNHDFWMRDYLSSEFKIKIHLDKFTLSIGGKNFYIFHGDGLTKKDWGYRFLKKIFRNKYNILLYSLVHPDIGIPFAKWISNLSRQHTSQNSPPDDKDYLNKAFHLFENGYDYVICGHLHFPTFKKFEQKIYINLGDWINHFTYAEYKNNKLELKKWQK
jgi:UDP-2,3-diacylglucosamine hydrolase